MRGIDCGGGRYEESFSMLIRTVDAYHVRLGNSGEILNIFNSLLRPDEFSNESPFL